MSTYAEKRANAARMLARSGQRCTLRQYSAPTYDTATGTGTAAPTETDFPVWAAIFDYKTGDYLKEGALIQVGDKRAYMEAGVVVPTFADTLIDAAGVEYSIVPPLGDLNPAGVPVLYDLHLRA